MRLKFTITVEVNPDHWRLAYGEPDATTQEIREDCEYIIAQRLVHQPVLATDIAHTIEVVQHGTRASAKSIAFGG